MNRIAPLDPTKASPKAQELLGGVHAKLGMTPNMMRVMAHAPAALEGYLGLSNTLGGGAFDGKLREQIALTVAETNLCGYCLSAHTLIGGKFGLSTDELSAARAASSTNARTDALLKLARAIVLSRGELSDADLKTARAAGVSDAELVETIANVALNLFTNYVNHVARTAVDFPEVKPGLATVKA
jgi:uncharacterized peroxidase-related enzyme